MSKRWWLLGLVGLVLAGLLVGCGSKYNSSSNGLVLVGSQGSNVIQSFSFNLNSGSVSAINNPPGITGPPSVMVVDPAGQYVYVASEVNCTPKLTANANFTNVSLTGAFQAAITAYKVNSDGSLAGKVTPQYMQGNTAYPPTPLSTDPATPPLPKFPACGLDDTTNPAAGNPIASLAVDSSGKFLYVAMQNSSVTYSYTDITNPQSPVNQTSTAQLPSLVAVLSIGSGGTLTPVQSSYTLALPIGFQSPNFVAAAPTPTKFPGLGINGTQNSVCSAGSSPPTSEYLYAVDSVNYAVWEFSVNTSTGALGNPSQNGVPPFATDKVPAGVAVDPCDRFVYVSDSLTSKVSAYTICFAVHLPSPCPMADGSLVPVTGSPFSLSGSANGAGPLVVDPYGNNVYVVGTASNTISAFKISPVSGSLTPLNPATVATGNGPRSIAIRGDDNWLFVTNYLSASVSQYSITPATGALSVLPTIQTDNNPWGVAVK
ncbi:MAG TPA: beta-propeller fold lactonase family protein [Candidatus Dormibacteraeota bacterium]|nr:beta-propeller fold lactonase family protein [Candidatus Dormibacteraeota bacterium]